MLSGQSYDQAPRAGTQRRRSAAVTASAGGGGVILFSRISIAATAARSDAIHSVRQPSLLIGVDHEDEVGCSAFGMASHRCPSPPSGRCYDHDPAQALLLAQLRRTPGQRNPRCWG